ncbi:hypothetical protein [Geodermatophilus amargosae]|uniref:hypothetical protein n=1 Tax=Geodermatophilus amargosae TaxID=1296565 RepID=UPI0034DE5BE7
MWRSNPIVGLMVSDLTADHQAAVRRTPDGMLRDRRDDEGRAAPAARLDIGVGTT